MVLGRLHVDEIDHDQPTQVAQPQLPADFLGGLKVGAGRRFLDVTTLGGFRRIDVDSDQCLGRLDDDGTAARQTDRAGESRLDLTFDLVACEQRHAVLVELELAHVLRHDLLHELLRLLVELAVVDQDLGDVVAQIVAHRANDDIAVLEDQKG